MSIVRIKLHTTEKPIKFVKLIHEFDRTIPITEIKRRIEEGDFVHEFDLDASDWMYMEKMTEYKWHKRYLKFLKSLEDAGATLEIYMDDQRENMQFLKNWINTMRGISIECERYPD